jgi:hypothetical protein
MYIKFPEVYNKFPAVYNKFPAVFVSNVPKVCRISSD